MERLTRQQSSEDGPEFTPCEICYMRNTAICKNKSEKDCWEMAMYNRLAAYEDTGLEPEEIVKMGMAYEDSKRYSGRLEGKLDAYRALGTVEELSALVKARDEGRAVVLNMPRKPLVWGGDDHDTCLCPDCGEDLMGIPYGEFEILQCPVCGQYLDATKIITRAEAEAAIGGDEGVR